MAFEDTLWTQGQDNMSGLVGDLYWCPAEDVDMTSPPALDADGVTVTGTIALKALKKFFRIYHTRGTGKIDDTMVGERDGKSFEVMCVFKFPGDTPEYVNLMKEGKNTPILLIGKDAQGRQRLVGMSLLNGSLSMDLPAYFDAETGTTGDQASSAKGHEITVKAESNHPPLFYEGVIDVDALT